MPRLYVLSATALAASSFAAAAAASAPRPPPVPPSTGAVASGIYRNMFSEAGYAAADIDAKIAAAYAQLYLTGDPATQRIAFEVPGSMMYVSDMKNGDVRTEGMSYAMMLAVQPNNRTAFDMLWRWVLVHMYHSDGPLEGWSAWHCFPNGTVIDEGPAPDGETFFITALYFAGARWGDGGAYNYSRWADTVLALVSQKPDPQQMFEPASRIVRFDPGTPFTDPSYMLPSFYVAWALAGSVTPPLWNASAAAARDLLHAVTAPLGLAPNQCDFAGGPAGWAQDYEDDAWRVARNWGMDYAWWAADARQISMSNSILAFFSECGGGNASRCACDYFIPKTGACTRNFYSPGAAAMNAVAALASNESLAWDAVDALWSMPIPSGDERDADRYYSGSLYIEALLHLSGRYRAWLR